MITTTDFYKPLQLMDEVTDNIDSISIELWDDDNTVIRTNDEKVKGEHQFRFEISQEDAIKMAKIILAMYEQK